MFEEYEDLMIKKREIETRLDEIKPYLIPAVPEDKNLVTERGYFYIQKRSSWKFSPAVDQADKALKKMQADEKRDGTATATYAETLYYKTGEPKEQ